MVESCDGSWVGVLACDDSILGEGSSGGHVGDRSGNLGGKPWVGGWRAQMRVTAPWPVLKYALGRQRRTVG